MHDRDRGRLALLEPIQADIDLRSAQRPAFASRDQDVPFPLWLTMEQMLGAAEDAELRAAMLRLWGAHSAIDSGTNRTAELLQEVAVDLRVLAGRLLDAPEPRS